MRLSAETFNSSSVILLSAVDFSFKVKYSLVSLKMIYQFSSRRLIYWEKMENSQLQLILIIKRVQLVSCNGMIPSIRTINSMIIYRTIVDQAMVNNSITDELIH